MIDVVLEYATCNRSIRVFFQFFMMRYEMQNNLKRFNTSVEFDKNRTVVQGIMLVDFIDARKTRCCLNNFVVNFFLFKK